MWSKFCVVFDRCGPTFVWFLVYVVQLRCVWPHHAPLLSSASSRPPITSPCPLLINTTATTSSIRTISSGAVFLSSGHHTSCKSIWIYLKNDVKLNWLKMLNPWWIEKAARGVWFVFGRFGWEGLVPEITMKWKICQDWDGSPFFRQAQSKKSNILDFKKRRAERE